MSKAHDKAEAKPVHRHKPDHAQPVLTDAAASFGLPGTVLRLQNMIGNQAVQGLLNRKEAVPSGPQGIRVALRSGTPDISREDDPVAMAREHYEEGERLFNAGSYAAAITRFERARQVPSLGDEVYRDLIWNLAVANSELERFASAVFYLEQYLTMGISEADRTAAESMLQEMRAGTAEDAEGILEREGADVPAATGDAAADTARAEQLYTQAFSLFAEGQFRQALIIFEQVREMPDMSEDIRRDTIFNIARCNMELRRAATAIPCLEEYLRMPGASHAEAIALLTESQEAAGAMTSTEQARLVYRLADEAYNAGQHREAERLFRIILNNPVLDANTLADIHYNLGETLFLQGRYDEALTEFQAYTALHPDDAEVLARIEECQRRIGAAVPEAE
jgi:tetratricopeptide (TPR) repeat protein